RSSPESGGNSWRPSSTPTGTRKTPCATRGSACSPTSSCRISETRGERGMPWNPFGRNVGKTLPAEGPLRRRSAKSALDAASGALGVEAAVHEVGGDRVETLRTQPPLEDSARLHE